MKVHWSLVSVVAGALLASAGFTGPAFADGPTVTAIRLSRPSPEDTVPTDVYPVVDGYRDKITVSGGATGTRVVHIELSTSETDAPETQVFQTDVPVDFSGSFEVTLGADLLGKVESRTYYVWARPDDATDPSAWASTPLTVSLQQLVTKTWTRTVTPARSTIIDKYVGTCSTLRRPSLRGWSGSWGYYSNTRCKKTAKKGLVATVHQLVVPAISHYPGSYRTIRIAVRGAAAKSRPRSRAVLAYLDGYDVVDAGTAGSKYGTYVGPEVAATEMLNGRDIRWGAFVGSGNRYDIKSFTVTLTYTVLQ